MPTSMQSPRRCTGAKASGESLLNRRSRNSGEFPARKETGYGLFTSHDNSLRRFIDQSVKYEAVQFPEKTVENQAILGFQR